MMMAAAAPCPALCSCSPRPASSLSSPLMVLPSRTPKSHALGSVSLMRLGFDSTWSGLKHCGILARQNHVQREKKGRCRGRVVYASLFGVGAPEALVIGVVALLVFGPKGLAEVARNLGKTLRAFQPTIRELQEVSREFKSSLEQEIGLNEVTSSLSNTYRPTSLGNEMEQTVADPNGKPSKPYSSEDLLKVTEEQLATSVVRPLTEESKPEEEPQAAPKTTELTAESPEVTTSVTSPDAAAAQTPLPDEAENERK